MTRFIFITGGVFSSLGKGLSSAALGALLQTRGYRVRLRKLDTDERKEQEAVLETYMHALGMLN